MNKPPKVKGMSKEYNDQIYHVSYFFLGLTRVLPALKLTEAQIEIGTDSLEGKWRQIVKGTFEFWLHYNDYELSYNQVNLALWWAVREAGKLEIINVPLSEKVVDSSLIKR